MRVLHEAGDSIVEVLIAIAIVSLVLVSAYAITNKNAANLQLNQERIQAQHLVEGQIEVLRSNPTAIDSSHTCFNGTTAVNGTACQNLSQAGSGAKYTVAITTQSSPSPTDPSKIATVYVVKATWTSLGSQTNNDSNVTMYYRVQ